MAWGVPGLEEDGFLPMARPQTLRDGVRVTRSHGGRRWLLIVEGGRAFGLEDRCPHFEAALAKGDCDGRVFGPKHGFCFDGDGRAPFADPLAARGRPECVPSQWRLGGATPKRGLLMDIILQIYAIPTAIG